MSTRELVTAALMAALVAAGALVTIPTQPVPFTLQLLFVLMTGLILRPGAAAASMTVYLGMGMAGLPVFSKGQAGVGVLAGPTGGYLVGFAIAAFAVSVIAGPVSGRTSYRWRLAGSVAGLGIVHAAGVTWLALSTGIGLAPAILAGAVPFIGLDLAKAAAAPVGAAAAERAQGAARAKA